jgi:aryl-alcohol dehydrogenase-like predicted oxidoreductase
VRAFICSHHATRFPNICISGAPLCRGILARPPSSGQTERSSQDGSKTGYSDVDKQIVKRVQEIAEKRGWKMSHVALAWINKRIASPIIGFSSVARMDEALEIKGKELTPEEEKYLEELYEARSIEGHS